MSKNRMSRAHARARSALSMNILLSICLSLCQATPAMAASGCSGARSDAVKNVRFRISHSLSPVRIEDSVKNGESDSDYNKYINWDTKDGAQSLVTVASAWSAGGGPRMIIPSDSATPFAGREYGGGERSHIYGTRLYGSGYPYSSMFIFRISTSFHQAIHVDRAL
jgi:hypothetical protein